MDFKAKGLKFLEEEVSVGRVVYLRKFLMRAMNEVDLGLRLILSACLGFQYGGTTLGKGNCSISQVASSLLAHPCGFDIAW